MPGHLSGRELNRRNTLGTEQSDPVTAFPALPHYTPRALRQLLLEEKRENTQLPSQWWRSTDIRYIHPDHDLPCSAWLGAHTALFFLETVKIHFFNPGTHTQLREFKRKDTSAWMKTEKGAVRVWKCLPAEKGGVP